MHTTGDQRRLRSPKGGKKSLLQRDEHHSTARVAVARAVCEENNLLYPN